MDGEFDFGKGAMLTLIIIFVVCLISQAKEIDRLKATLDDPHHCVSVCVEEFEKYGC